jgi:uncharacterized membrane protein
MTSVLIRFIFGVALFLIAIIIGPLLGIWSLNTLFPVLAIPYTWETWLAFALLFTSSSIYKFKK